MAIIKNPLSLITGDVNFKKQDKTVVPSKETIIVKPDPNYDALELVTVKPIPDNYVDEVIVYDGAYETVDGNGSGEIIGYVLQPILTVTPTTDKQVITPSNDYDGYEEVVVNAIPSEYIVPTGELTVGANGEYNITDYKKIIVSVAGGDGNGVGVNVDTIVANMQSIVLEQAPSDVIVESTGPWGYFSFGSGAIGAGSRGVVSVYQYTNQNKADDYLIWTKSGRIKINNNMNYNAVLVRTINANSVSVYAVGNPTETFSATTNGEYDVAGYKNVAVSTPQYSLNSITITQNGTYTAAGDYNGYNSITVSVDVAASFRAMLDKLNVENIGVLNVQISASHGGEFIAINVETGQAWTETSSITGVVGVYYYSKDDTLEISRNGTVTTVTGVFVNADPGGSVYLQYGYSSPIDGTWAIGASLYNYPDDYIVTPTNLMVGNNNMGLLESFSGASGPALVTVEFSDKSYLKIYEAVSSQENSYIIWYDSSDTAGRVLFNGSLGGALQTWPITPSVDLFRIMDIKAENVNTAYIYTANEIRAIVEKWLCEHLPITKSVV